MNGLQGHLSEARAALDSGDHQRIVVQRDALLRWHELHHSPTPPPGWSPNGAAVQGIYCTGCQVWPVIVSLNQALNQGNADG